MAEENQFTPHTERLRRNLLALSVIALFFAIFEVEWINLGVIKLEKTGTGDVAIRVFLIFAILYHLIGFLWTGLEEATKWAYREYVKVSDDEYAKATEWAKKARDRVPNVDKIDEGKLGFGDLTYLTKCRTFIRQKAISSHVSKFLYRVVKSRLFVWEFLVPVALAFLGLISLFGIWDLHVVGAFFVDALGDNQAAPAKAE